MSKAQQRAADPESTWGRSEDYKQEWTAQHADAARKATEKANEERAKEDDQDA